MRRSILFKNVFSQYWCVVAFFIIEECSHKIRPRIIIKRTENSLCYAYNCTPNKMKESVWNLRNRFSGNVSILALPEFETISSSWILKSALVHNRCFVISPFPLLCCVVSHKTSCYFCVSLLRYDGNNGFVNSALWASVFCCYCFSFYIYFSHKTNGHPLQIDPVRYFIDFWLYDYVTYFFYLYYRYGVKATFICSHRLVV